MNNSNNNIKAQIQIMIKKEQKKLHHHLQDLGKMWDIGKLKLKEQYASTLWTEHPEIIWYTPLQQAFQFKFPQASSSF